LPITTYLILPAEVGLKIQESSTRADYGTNLRINTTDPMAQGEWQHPSRARKQRCSMVSNQFPGSLDPDGEFLDHTSSTLSKVEAFRKNCLSAKKIFDNSTFEAISKSNPTNLVCFLLTSVLDFLDHLMRQGPSEAHVCAVATRSSPVYRGDFIRQFDL
jgi:hypothetical protein